MHLASAVIDLYSFVVLAAVVISWTRMDRRHRLAQLVSRVTEPVLAPIRSVLPPIGGMDFSPMVLLIALRTLGGLW